MERIRINESRANELVKKMLINYFGYSEDLELSRVIGDDNRPYYMGMDVVMYHGEPTKRIIPLQFKGYINHLKVALQEIGYEGVGWIDVIVKDDEVSYEFDGKIADYGYKNNKRSNEHGLRLHRTYR